MASRNARRKRSRTAAPDASPAELPVPDTGDEEHLVESMSMRVLRAQVRTLEQALEEAEARAAEQVQPGTRDELIAAVEHVDHPVAEVAETPDTVVTDALPSLPHVVPGGLVLPDIVLPVPPPVEPEVLRSQRWFRRSAA